MIPLLVLILIALVFPGLLRALSIGFLLLVLVALLQIH
jgi:hypothetical protein